MFQLLMLAADEAHGAESAGVMPDGAGSALMPAITSLVVFLVAFFILWRTVWPKIVKGLDDREAKIRDEIASAEEAREQAKKALHDYESELAKAREEASGMIAKAKGDAQAAANDLRERNNAELSEMKQRATQEIENAKQGAIADIHGEATNLAAAIAGKILQREISAEDQQRLVEESLRELAAQRN